MFLGLFFNTEQCKNVNIDWVLFVLSSLVLFICLFNFITL